MKTPWILGGALLCLAACQSGTQETKEPAASETVAAIEEAPLPSDVAYKGEASIGNSDNVRMVMNWNRFLSEKKSDSAAALLADSVYIELANGTVFNTSRDSLMSAVNGMLNSIDSLKVDFVAVMPVNVATKEGTDEWVFSWTDEKTYEKNGLVHNGIHEDYQFKNGKIWKIYQYRKKPVPEDKGK